MTNKSLVPEQLIERFMNGQLSSSEEKSLLNWIDLSPENADLFLKEQKRLMPLMSALDDAVVDKQWRRLHQKARQANARRDLKSSISRFRIPAVAAVLVFALIGYFMLDRKQTTQNWAELTESIVTHNGQRTSIELSDGTKVSLNANSKLMFPRDFKGSVRRVELAGEAYFEVAPDKEFPFIVHTSALNIRVLGTAFNIEAFPGNTEVSTTLVHGKVVLERELNKQTVPLAEMNPLDRVVFNVDNQKIRIQKQIKPEQYIGWKDGKLVFLNASVEELAKKLELWFNVSVQIQGEDLKNAHFTGTFTNETIEQVLNLLTISYPLDFRIEKVTGNQGLNGPELKIILSSKSG